MPLLSGRHVLESRSRKYSHCGYRPSPHAGTGCGFPKVRRALAATMARMDAQESPPVHTGAVPPPEGTTLGRLLALLGEGVSAEGLETQLAAMEAENLLDPARIRVNRG